MARRFVAVNARPPANERPSGALDTCRAARQARLPPSRTIRVPTEPRPCRARATARTPEQEWRLGELARLYGDGLTFREITARLGIHRTRVEQLLEQAQFQSMARFEHASVSGRRTALPARRRRWPRHRRKASEEGLVPLSASRRTGRGVRPRGRSNQVSYRGGAEEVTNSIGEVSCSTYAAGGLVGRAMRRVLRGHGS